MTNRIIILISSCTTYVHIFSLYLCYLWRSTILKLHQQQYETTGEIDCSTRLTFATL